MTKKRISALALALAAGLACAPLSDAGYKGKIGGTGFQTGGVKPKGKPTPAGQKLLDKIKMLDMMLNDMQARQKAIALHEGVCKAIALVKKRNATVGQCLEKLKKKGSICISFDMDGAYGTAINDGKAECNENDKININADNFAEGCPPPYDPDLYWLVTTLLHEGTHAIQDYMPDTSGLTPEEARATVAKRRMCNEAGTGVGADPKGAHVIENEWITELKAMVAQLRSATPTKDPAWSDATKEIFDALNALMDVAPNMARTDAINAFEKAYKDNEDGNNDAIECYRKGKAAMQAFLDADKSTPEKKAMALQALRMALNQAKWKSTISRFFKSIEGPKIIRSNSDSGMLFQNEAPDFDTGLPSIQDMEIFRDQDVLYCIGPGSLPFTSEIQAYSLDGDGMVSFGDLLFSIPDVPQIPEGADLIVHPVFGTVLIYAHETAEFFQLVDSNFDQIPDQFDPIPVFQLPGPDAFLQEWAWGPNSAMVGSGEMMLFSADFQDSMRPAEFWNEFSVPLLDENGDGIPDTDLGGPQQIYDLVDFAPTWGGDPVPGDDFMDVFAYAENIVGPPQPFFIDVVDPTDWFPIEPLGSGIAVDGNPVNVPLNRPLQPGEAILITHIDRGATDFTFSPILQMPCPGNGPDADGNGFVDGADLAGLLSVWGSSAFCYDFNADGIVDGADLAQLLASWGPFPGT